jgi:hypothetical protein
MVLIRTSQTLLRTAGNADPQCTITQSDEANNKYTEMSSRQTTEISDSIDLHLIIKDVLY